MLKIKIIIKLLRVEQWPKNIFVFAPLFFAGELLHTEKLAAVGIGFFVFCFASSGIYIINDILDVVKDQQHPLKKFRPIPSSLIPIKSAWTIAILLIGLSVICAYYIHPGYIIIIAAYTVLNIFYSMGLKNVSILDLSILSFGFVLRVWAGGLISDILVSHWLFMMTFLLALFIAFAKRRDDVLIYHKTGNITRGSVMGYNKEFINSGMNMVSSLIIVLYLLYVTSDEIILRFNYKPVYVSALFIILGILRYKQITFVDENSGSPSMHLLKDVFLQLCIIGWVLFYIYLIYIN